MARSVKMSAPIFERLATALAEIDTLRSFKIFPGGVSASTQLSNDGKKNPVVDVGAPGLVAVELLIDTKARIVRFCALTSAEKGNGEKMVVAVWEATPEDWFVAVPFGWSGGSWRRMAENLPGFRSFRVSSIRSPARG